MMKPFLIMLIAALLSAASKESAADPLRIYTWREDTAQQLPGCIALVWARANNGGLAQRPDIDYDTARPAKLVADEVAAELRTRRPQDRAVFLWHGGVVHGTEGQPELFPDTKIAEAYARGGFLEFTHGWMSTFWQQLALSNLEPSVIVLDYEKAWGFWGLNTFTNTGSDLVSKSIRTSDRLIAMSRIQSALGYSPTGFQPIDYLNFRTGSWNREPVLAFNKWQMDRRAQALRTTIFEPAARAFGHDIPSSNFGEQMRAWEGADLNGWPTRAYSISGTISSPSTYLGIEGKRYELVRGKTLAFRRALNWVDMRNEVRSAVAAGSRAAPWYSNPDFRRDAQQSALELRLQWAAGLLHDRSIGVNMMLFWSEDAWSPDEAAFANKIIEHLKSMSPASIDQVVPLSELDPESAMAPWVNLARTLTLQPE